MLFEVLATIPQRHLQQINVEGPIVKQWFILTYSDGKLTAWVESELNGG